MSEDDELAQLSAEDWARLALLGQELELNPKDRRLAFRAAPAAAREVGHG